MNVKAAAGQLSICIFFFLLKIRNCLLFPSISLVETIPFGLIYPNGTTPHPSTYDTWLDLINNAQHTIEIASLYWSLRSADVVPDSSSQEVRLLLTSSLISMLFCFLLCFCRAKMCFKLSFKRGSKKTWKSKSPKMPRRKINRTSTRRFWRKEKQPK